MKSVAEGNADLTCRAQRLQSGLEHLIVGSTLVSKRSAPGPSVGETH